MLHVNRKILGTGLILMTSLGLWALHPAQSVAINQSTTEFPTSSQPWSITTGPDGNLWFTEENAIGQITPNGVVTEFPLPSGNSGARDITAGPDGNIWFTLPYQNKVGHITTAGIITVTAGFTVPWGITLGPDGNIWITEWDHVAQITTTGTITSFAIAPESYPESIITGSDGNLWYIITIAHKSGNKIGRITPTGVYTEFNVLTWNSGIFDLTAGQDGNIWFTESNAGKIGRITPTGVVTEFVLPLNQYGFPPSPGAITNGPDGNVWFTSDDGIGRISLSGSVSFFSGHGSLGITTGPDGNIWYTNYWGQIIGRLHIYQYFLPFVSRH